MADSHLYFHLYGKLRCLKAWHMSLSSFGLVVQVSYENVLYIPDVVSSRLLKLFPVVGETFTWKWVSFRGHTSWSGDVRTQLISYAGTSIFWAVVLVMQQVHSLWNEKGVEKPQKKKEYLDERPVLGGAHTHTILFVFVFSFFCWFFFFVLSMWAQLFLTWTPPITTTDIHNPSLFYSKGSFLARLCDSIAL